MNLTHSFMARVKKKPVPIGRKSKDWLFETRMNLPSDANAELDRIGFDELPDQVRIHLLNEILEERQVSSAPKWWEMNFFQFSTNDLWEFFVEQCRRNYEIDHLTSDLFPDFRPFC